MCFFCFLRVRSVNTGRPSVYETSWPPSICFVWNTGSGDQLHRFLSCSFSDFFLGVVMLFNPVNHLLLCFITSKLGWLGALVTFTCGDATKCISNSPSGFMFIHRALDYVKYLDLSIPVPFDLVEIFDLSLYTAGIQ